LLALLFAFVVLCVAAPHPRSASADAPASFDPNAAYVYVPASVRDGSKPAQVMLALHGMGGEGKGFCQGFLNAAEQNGWVIVAPTFSYRNWKDPAIVAADDVALTASLVDLLDTLPERIGRPVEPKAIVLGFSRGAQLAHRFAEIYPDRTRAAVVISAGSYTLPTASDAQGQALPFPFGTADLGRRAGRAIAPKALGAVPFWVAVGGNDANPDDVPRQWDATEGTTRLQRAGSFVRSLTDAGVTANLTVFPNTGHEVSPAMVRGAVEFLRQLAAPASSADPVAHAPTVPHWRFTTPFAI
jgi:pimeloyl-ACP methyl ester carboxylesterase